MKRLSEGRNLANKKRVFIVTILISLVTAYASFFLYNNWITIYTREQKLLEKEKSLNKTYEELSLRNKNLDEQLEEYKIKNSEIVKKEENITLQEKQLVDKENTLKEKEKCLSDRLDAINKKLEIINNSTSGKVVYLTFDDGPSENTSKILDILDQYSIKATFFVNGHPGYEKTYLRIFNDGNSIGNHTYSHDYGQEYASVSAFDSDVDKLKTYLDSIGIKQTTLLRFPGGSNNTVSIKYGGNDIMNKIVKNEVAKGYDYVDWNVSSGDAEAITVPKKKIIDNVINGCKGKDKVVILFHDSKPKTTTVEALPDIIEYLIGQGYSFKVLQTGVAPWAKFMS